MHKVVIIRIQTRLLAPSLPHFDYLHGFSVTRMGHLGSVLCSVQEDTNWGFHYVAFYRTNRDACKSPKKGCEAGKHADLLSGPAVELLETEKAKTLDGRRAGRN
jgi:hypothetical protein